jgi:predicted Rossmann fold flavoprotein
VQILRDGVVFAHSGGELQFTDYGLSGPVIFEISRDVCYGAGEWIARLDFLPHIPCDDLHRELCRRRDRNMPMEELFTGLLHNRLGRVLTKAAGVTGTLSGELVPEMIDELVAAVKAFEIVLTEPMGMDNAQVTAGGVYTRDFDPQTMESRLIPGLYACGEVLDIDGDCGGYNLQWAWSSGIVAGRNAGKETT